MSEPISPEDLAQGILSGMVHLRHTNIRNNPAYTAKGPVKEILSRYDESRLTECPHIALLDIPPGFSRVKRPEVVLWAAWKPDLLVCHDCREMLAASDEIDEHTCDGCGKICEVIGAGTSVIPSEVKGMPPLVCAYGLCDECSKASGIV